MNKEKIKSWVKEHKNELIGFAVGGGLVLLVHGRGVQVGKKKAFARIDKVINKLGDSTFVSVCSKYTVKDLGQVGLDSLKAVGCPESIDENSKVNAIFYFYDAK